MEVIIRIVGGVWIDDSQELECHIDSRETGRTLKYFGVYWGIDRTIAKAREFASAQGWNVVRVVK